MKFIFAFLLWASFFFVNGQSIIDSRQNEVVFRNVNVVPMDREQVLENQTVVVKGGKIISVSNAKTAKYGKTASIIDGQGKYLMPGLGEMHAHVPPVDDLVPMKEVAMLFAVNGITTIRGMLGHPRHLELRSKLQSDEILGPHFYTTGPSFNGQTAKTPEQATAMVREQKQAGYNYLKIHPGINRETYAAIVQTAKEVNIPWVGHVPFQVGIWQTIAAGQSTIDHMDGFVEGLVPGMENITEQQAGLFGMFLADKADVAQMPKLMQALKAKNVWVVPTQALAERWFSPAPAEQFQQAPEMVYMAPEVRKNWENSKKSLQANPLYSAAKLNSYIQLRRQLIAACQKNGVGLLLGSDAPQIFNVPGFSTHQELQYLVDAGLTPYQALCTGTVNAAAYLNQTGKSGIVKEGAASDLVLLAGNPLKDIAQTRRIEGVMLGHRWLPKSYLDQELKKLVKP